MGGVLTLAATVATAAGAVAAVRFLQRRQKDVADMIRKQKTGEGAILDYERDPETGVYRQRD